METIKSFAQILILILYKRLPTPQQWFFDSAKIHFRCLSITSIKKLTLKLVTQLIPIIGQESSNLQYVPSPVQQDGLVHKSFEMPASLLVSPRRKTNIPNLNLNVAQVFYMALFLVTRYSGASQELSLICTRMPVFHWFHVFGTIVQYHTIIKQHSQINSLCIARSFVILI